MEYNYLNPLSVTSQFSFCGLPFRLDTYAGCAFSCCYCFARIRGGNIKSKKLRIANPESIITRFRNAQHSNAEKKGIITEYIQRRMPVHFGGMSDPFQSIEKNFKVSLTVLQYLAEINYPVIISTKSTLVGEEPYLSLLKSYPNILIQFSFSTLNSKFSEILEPNVPSPNNLLKTIEKLSSNNIKTSIRWQPYIPFLSEKPKDFISKISHTGAIHLGFEHLKFPLENNNPLQSKIQKITSIDLLDYYKKEGSKCDGREFILPSKTKKDIILQVKEETNKIGMTFGAADNEFQYLSDTDCCCSGVDQLDGFEKWNKFQISYAIKKSLEFKDIRFSNIDSEWKPQGSIDKHINSKSRLKKGIKSTLVEDYIKDRWQNLNSPFNPTNYEGITFNGRFDEAGMKIYNWKE